MFYFFELHLCWLSTAGGIKPPGSFFVRTKPFQPCQLFFCNISEVPARPGDLQTLEVDVPCEAPLSLCGSSHPGGPAFFHRDSDRFILSLNTKYSNSAVPGLRSSVTTPCTDLCVSLHVFQVVELWVCMSICSATQAVHASRNPVCLIL